MREILFRGKRKDNDEWAYGFYVNSFKFEYSKEHHDCRGDYRPAIQLIGSQHVVEVIPKSVGQYTGLQSNGKKIFEGDIIKISGRSSFYGEVTYSEVSTSYWVENKNLEYFAELSSIKPSFIEVVGNVIDNSELLKNTYFHREDKT